MLEEQGAIVDYFDPNIPVIPETRKHFHLAGRKSVKWVSLEFKKYDASLICTDHDGVDYADLVNHTQLVVDTRNVTGKLPFYSEKVHKA